MHENDTLQLKLCCSSVFRNTPSTNLYTLSLHDALPIYPGSRIGTRSGGSGGPRSESHRADIRGESLPGGFRSRSEEHTSELQSRGHLVCRLLLEKKK